MLTEVKLPELGENIEAGDVIKVTVAVGDIIDIDQTILEIETDKAAIEVPSPVAGTVTAVHVGEGDAAKVGQVLLTVEGDDIKAEEKPTASKPAPAAKPTSTGGNGKTAPAPAATAVTPVPSNTPGERLDLIPAAPSVRRRARELNIDIRLVQGTNIGGRLSMLDVERQAIPPAVAPPVAAPPLPDFSKWGEVSREKMRGVRKKTAEHLSQTWATVPQVTHYDKADITEVEKLRKQFADKAAEAGGKLTVTAILLKACAAGLKKFPNFNASVDMTAEEIVYKSYINIGIAVDTDRGLLVPVIRDVASKSTIELAVELTEVSKKARDKKLTVADMQGGNFTISNLGGIGGVGFSPIVNAPEVAILGVSRAALEPRFINERWEPRKIMPLALSYDHRLVDGADAARFLHWIVEALEQPAVLAIEA